MLNSFKFCIPGFPNYTQTLSLRACPEYILVLIQIALPPSLSPTNPGIISSFRRLLCPPSSLSNCTLSIFTQNQSLILTLHPAVLSLLAKNDIESYYRLPSFFQHVLTPTENLELAQLWGRFGDARDGIFQFQSTLDGGVVDHLVIPFGEINLVRTRIVNGVAAEEKMQKQTKAGGSTDISDELRNELISRVCSECGKRNSPEWRRGPTGQKTLCNACGLRFSRKEKKSIVNSA